MKNDLESIRWNNPAGHRKENPLYKQRLCGVGIGQGNLHHPLLVQAGRLNQEGNPLHKISSVFPSILVVDKTPSDGCLKVRLFDPVKSRLMDWLN
jgi:hypothetical protein